MLRREHSGRVHYYRWTQDDDWLGEAQLHTNGDGVIWLWAFEIYPEFWGQGHGKAFLTALLHEAWCWHAKSVRLWVDPNNTIAQRLYVSSGFVPAGRTERGLLMVRDLTENTLDAVQESR